MHEVYVWMPSTEGSWGFRGLCRVGFGILVSYNGVTMELRCIASGAEKLEERRYADLFARWCDESG